MIFSGFETCATCDRPAIAGSVMRPNATWQHYCDQHATEAMRPSRAWTLEDLLTPLPPLRKVLHDGD